MTPNVESVQAAEAEKTEYKEATLPVLSERDATAIINSIRYPGKRSERMSAALRRYQERTHTAR